MPGRKKYSNPAQFTNHPMGSFSQVQLQFQLSWIGKIHVRNSVTVCLVKKISCRHARFFMQCVCVCAGLSVGCHSEGAAIRSSCSLPANSRDEGVSRGRGDQEEAVTTLPQCLRDIRPWSEISCVNLEISATVFRCFLLLVVGFFGFFFSYLKMHFF